MKQIVTVYSALILVILTTGNVLADNDTCSKKSILTAKNCPGDGLEIEEQRLYDLVNQYRLQYGLPSIPIAPSLTLIANRHVRDLAENIGYLTHSWSNCRYDNNQPYTWLCMWQAPQRFKTAYPHQAFEILYAKGYKVSALTAFQDWQRNPVYNAMILNQHNWNVPWQALGIGIYQRYAVLWLGTKPEPVTTSITLLPPLGVAQATDVNNKPVKTTTTFAGGIAVGKGAFENKVSVTATDTVTVRGLITVDPNHVDKPADIVVYVRATLPDAKAPQFYMLDEQGNPQPWDEQLTQLQPLKKAVTLNSTYPIELYRGNFDFSAILQAYFGYRLSLDTEQIIWVINKQPIDFKILKNPTTEKSKID